MEQLDQISNLICQDLPAWRAGAGQNDAILLETQRPRIYHYISILLELMPSIEGSDAEEVAIEYINELSELIAAIDHMSEMDDSYADCCLPMSVETAVYLRQLDMPWSKIAVVFGVSRQTMYKFRIANDIPEPNRRVGDEELQNLMVELTSENPEAGAVYLKGMLRVRRIKVSLFRVKQVLRQVDPCGVLRRRRQRIHRRVYKVKGANYLWHMDSNHKLIMFRFVLHGCIDGFSRKIIYLKVATNNLADTVLPNFVQGVEANGLPKFVRGDRGVENVRVKDFMEANRPQISNPFIQGRSIHNTRIERLWRETNLHVSAKYKSIFKFLESLEMLDEHDEVDLFSLAYVFLPRIQKDLDNFLAFYNNHSMRTMHGRTPIQVWTINMLQQSSMSQGGNDENDDDDDDDENNRNYDENFGSNENYFDYYPEDSGDNFENSRNQENEPIEVPQCSLSNAEIIHSALAEIVPDPLSDDGNYGIDMYAFVRNYILSHQI